MKLKIRNNDEYNINIVYRLEKRLDKEMIMPIEKKHKRFRNNLYAISFWTFLIGIAGFLEQSYIVLGIAFVYYFAWLFIDGYIYFDKVNQ